MGLFSYVMPQLSPGAIVSDGEDIGIIIGVTDISVDTECYVLYDVLRNVYHVIECEYLDTLINDGEVLTVLEHNDG
jgi:hypothetical protein